MTPERPTPDVALRERELPAETAGRAFFLRPTRTVARELIGSWIVRRVRGRLYGGRIVEAEAYLGVSDPAAHSFGGRRTARVEPMWGDGGLLYVYFVYGMHHCANLVTRPAGDPQAVLLRAAAHPRAAWRTLSGPGRLCRALGIVRKDSGADVAGRERFEIRVSPAPRRAVTAHPRIGIDYAGEARDWRLRYVLAGERAVTFPPSTR